MKKTIYLHLLPNEAPAHAVRNMFEAQTWKEKNIVHIFYPYTLVNPSKQKVLNISKNILWIIKFFIQTLKADKIILHSLRRHRLNFILYLPFLRNKIIWIMWGADIYKKYDSSNILNPIRKKLSDLQEKLRCYLAKNIKKSISIMPNDGKIAQKRFYMKGENRYLHYALTNINIPQNYKKYLSEEKVTILIGNSAAPWNNHEEILQKLIKVDQKNFLYYLPLSYGDKEHAKRVTTLFEKSFPMRVYPLLDFISFDDYIKLLSSIDIFIFAHNRQAGLFNIQLALKMGKKVYIKRDISTWKQYVIHRRYSIFPFDTIDTLSPQEFLTFSEQEQNKVLAQEWFDVDNIIREWIDFIEK